MKLIWLTDIHLNFLDDHERRKFYQDLAVLDIDMPEVDGLTAAAELHEQLPACRVLILTVLVMSGQSAPGARRARVGLPGQGHPVRAAHRRGAQGRGGRAGDRSEAGARDA